MEIKRIMISGLLLLLLVTSVSAATETFSAGFGDWFNVPGDGLAFTRLNSATPSTGTGPDMGVDGTGDYYIYAEADVFCNYNFTVEYPPVDFSDDVNVSWYYHMNTDVAIRMGWLYLEVEDTPGVWDVIWTIGKKDLGDVWNFNNSLITGYTGNHAIRFRYLTVPEIQCYNADVGLDNISIDAFAQPGQAPNQPINITFTSLNNPLKWQSQKYDVNYLSGVLNVTSTVVYEYNGVNTSVCGLCNSFNVTLPLLNITKTSKFKFYANNSGVVGVNTQHINFYYINVSLFDSNSPKLYFANDEYGIEKAKWEAGDVNNGPNFAHAYDKAKHIISLETFNPTTYAYNDFENIGLSPSSKSNDCAAAAIMCAFDGNVSSGQNTVYGSPTNYCVLMEKCMEDTNRWDNGAYNYAFMDILGRAYNNYALARDVGGQNMSSPLKAKIKEDFYNMSFHTLYRLRLDDSSGGVIGAGTANVDTTSRVMLAMGTISLLLSLDSTETVSGDFQYCDRIFTLTGTCDGTFGSNRVANETLFVGATTINRQMVIDAIVEEICGLPTSSADKSAGINWYNGYCFNFLYAQSGATYPNWVHQVQDPLFFTVLRGSGLDLFEMESDIYDGGLLLTDGERYNIPFEVSGHDLYATSQQWSVWRAYSLNKSRSNDDLMNYHMAIAEGMFIPYQYNGNAYVVQNGAFVGYFVWADDDTILLEDSVDDTDEALRCAGATNNISVLNSFGFGAIYKDKCDMSEFSLYLRAKQHPVDLGRQRTAQGGFYLFYKDVYLVSPAGSPDQTNMNDDGSAPFASGEGFNVTDPCLYNNELDMEEWMHASNMQNVLLVDGYGAQSTQCLNGTKWLNNMKDPFVISDSFDNNLYSVLVMDGDYTNSGVKSVDYGGVSLKRTFVYDKNIVLLIDSVGDTNGSSHNYSRQFQLGEGVSKGGVQSINRDFNNATHCEQGLCVDFYFDTDVDLFTYDSGDATHDSGEWGYNKILVATSQSYDDMLSVIYPRTQGNLTINFTSLSDDNSIGVVVGNISVISYFNLSRSNGLWRVTRWSVGPEEFIDKMYYNGSDYLYTTVQGAEVYPGTPGTPDIAPPVISGLTVGSIGLYSARIVFSTDEGANSSVFYYVFGNSSDNGTVNTVAYTTSHSVLLSGLALNTTYNYTLFGVCDVTGNCAASQTGSFSTLAPSVSAGNGDGLIGALLPLAVVLFIVSLLSILWIFINEDGFSDPKNIVYMIVMSIFVILGAVIIATLI